MGLSSTMPGFSQTRGIQSRFAPYHDIPGHGSFINVQKPGFILIRVYLHFLYMGH